MNDKEYKQMETKSAASVRPYLPKQTARASHPLHPRPWDRKQAVTATRPRLPCGPRRGQASNPAKRRSDWLRPAKRRDARPIGGRAGRPRRGPRRREAVGSEVLHACVFFFFLISKITYLVIKVFSPSLYFSGETRFNKEKIIQGQGVDEPLSETGFKQAAAAGIFLNNVKFTHVFSSDLTRTRQTVHGILEKSKVCKDMTVKYDSRLRERKYGVAEGRALSELRAMAKAAGEECPVFTPPGGETLDQVKMRGKDFFDILCQLILQEAGENEQFSRGAPSNCLETSLAEIFPLGKNCPSESNSDSSAPGLVASVLVVSHGAYMKSLFNYFLTDLKCSLPTTLNKSEFMSVSPNTGISLFIINFEKGQEGKPTVQCVCMYLQDHLSGMTETC
ncbi:fructose-2,6-bisphosphatase TIGAR [Panthera uncia]|uniref:fructose-2,6-bisphosphatase TIGAR n=1 Tax=Panthera uncia TaxID=29064 RepID=UPI0020FFD04C|nr:fructose-2,6-bisphosphatase TIGAR [Panthera uncia]